MCQCIVLIQLHIPILSIYNIFNRVFYFYIYFYIMYYYLTIFVVNKIQGPMLLNIDKKLTFYSAKVEWQWFWMIYSPIIIITGRSARSAAMPVCICSVVQKWGFRSARATHIVLINVKFGTGNALPVPNFTFIWAEMCEYIAAPKLSKFQFLAINLPLRATHLHNFCKIFIVCIRIS